MSKFYFEKILSFKWLMAPLSWRRKNSNWQSEFYIDLAILCCVRVIILLIISQLMGQLFMRRLFMYKGSATGTGGLTTPLTEPHKWVGGGGGVGPIFFCGLDPHLWGFCYRSFVLCIKPVPDLLTSPKVIDLYRIYCLFTILYNTSG